MGWGGMINGELLGLAQERFDISVTPDRNLISQQNLSKFHLAVLILAAPSNRLTDLRLLILRLLQALPFSKIRESKVVST